jgi:hypothetical protein
MHLLARHERYQTLPIQQPMSLTKVVRVDKPPKHKMLNISTKPSKLSSAWTIA